MLHVQRIVECATLWSYRDWVDFLRLRSEVHDSRYGCLHGICRMAVIMSYYLGSSRQAIDREISNRSFKIRPGGGLDSRGKEVPLRTQL
jgi:hypothetical protein